MDNLFPITFRKMAKKPFNIEKAFKKLNYLNIQDST